MSGLQPGATASFSAQTIASAADATQLTIATTSSTTTGNNTLTISATGNGNTKSTTAQLNITPFNSGGGGGGSAVLSNGQSVSASLSQGQQNSYRIAVPSGASQLSVNMTGSGDADLYVKYGSQATFNNYDCRPYTSTANESCTFSNPLPGDWFIMVNGYTASSYTLTARYSGGGGSGGAPVPHITDINPKSVSVGVNNTFTITGTGFQPGFSGALWVGSSSYPLYPGAQTNYISSTQVQLVVQVGSSGSPTTAFGLQIINPDSQASAIYTGLTAQGSGGGSSTTGHVQITFVPSSVTRDSGDGKFHFTVNLHETSGVGVTLTGMSAGGNDYSSNISSWFGSNYLPGNGSAGVNITTTCSSPCNFNDPWVFTGNDANGHNGLTWSATVFLGQ